jgi:RNA polymerase sigma-70 factor (ECF subfamily)
MIYCVVPRELALKLHELLRAHFRDDPTVEVVVERRGADRRLESERRQRDPDAIAEERRRIRGAEGRRVADRRASAVEVEQPSLPRRARPFAADLLFLERIEPTSEQVEDEDTARLVTRIQAGNRDGYAELYMRYFDRIYTYLRVALDDAHEAEDATQQVFVNALEALPRYERRGSPFRAWLFSITRNYLRTQLRRRARLELTDPATMSRDEVGREDEELRALSWLSDKDLMVFVERLPLAQRQVLVLRYMLDLTADETGALLGRTPADVRKLQSRALHFLRARLSAVGRVPRRPRSGMVRRLRKAPVLRSRRFALSP